MITIVTIIILQIISLITDRLPFLAIVWFIALMVAISKNISIIWLLNRLFYASPILLIPFILHLFFSEGISLAIFFTLRLFVFISLATILTKSIDVDDIKSELEYLLNRKNIPFRRFLSELFLTFILSIKFISQLKVEIEEISEMQKAKGFDFSNRGIIQRIKMIFPLIVPLFIIAIRKSMNTSAILYQREYNIVRTYTTCISPPSKSTSYLPLFSSLLLLIFIFYL